MHVSSYEAPEVAYHDVAEFLCLQREFVRVYIDLIHKVFLKAYQHFQEKPSEVDPNGYNIVGCFDTSSVLNRVPKSFPATLAAGVAFPVMVSNSFTRFDSTVVLTPC